MVEQRQTSIKVDDEVRKKIQLLKQRKGLENVNETINYLFDVGSNVDVDVSASGGIISKKSMVKVKEEKKK